MSLDRKALEAAIIAGDRHWEGDHPSTGIYEAAISSYLTAAVPADIAALVERLEKRAAFQEAMRKLDKSAFHEQVDISLAREAASALTAKNAELEKVHQRYVDANEARIDALRLMRIAHAVMRETGWHVAAPVGPTSDGVLEAACNELEADFAAFLKEHEEGHDPR